MTSERIAIPAAAFIARAADALRAGELIAFPTETVYGLGADASNAKAVQKIFAVKGRPSNHPVIVHIASASMLARWARVVPQAAEALARAFWPGPLTLILPRAIGVLDMVTGGQDSVGVRMPSHPVARKLLTSFEHRGGSGVAAPSANRFGHVSATTAAHVAAEFGHELAWVLDGGPCSVGIESTIVDCSREQPALLRPGGISVAQLAHVLGAAPVPSDGGAPRVSGSLSSHYAPRAPARAMTLDALTVALATASNAKLGVLSWLAEPPVSFAGVWRHMPQSPEAYAHELYAALRELDARHLSAIWIELPPEDDPWLAVRDRLLRATHEP